MASHEVIILLIFFNLFSAYWAFVQLKEIGVERKIIRSGVVFRKTTLMVLFSSSLVKTAPHWQITGISSITISNFWENFLQQN
jgi:hypothetical protein